MPRMTSKSVISNSTISTKVTLWYTIIGQFLYTCLGTMELPTRVDTEKGSAKVLGLTPKLTAIRSYKGA